MAKALQCPSCGTKKRLDGLATDTFRCENCGQVLKVPPVARPARGGGSSSPPPRGGAAAPPPRRRAAPPDSSPAPTGRPPSPAPAVPPVVTTPTSGPPGGTVVFPAGGGPAVPPAAPARGAGKPPRDAIPLWVRVGAWVLAVPIGLALVGVPARILGYLTSQRLLDVIVKHNLSRFVPLLVIVVLWALATTVLVEIFIEGGRWLMLRRRRRSGGPDEADDFAPGRVPPPRSSRSRRPAGTRRS
jgi:hypothetical protein